MEETFDITIEKGTYKSELGPYLVYLVGMHITKVSGELAKLGVNATPSLRTLYRIANGDKASGYKPHKCVEIINGIFTFRGNGIDECKQCTMLQQCTRSEVQQAKEFTITEGGDLDAENHIIFLPGICINARRTFGEVTGNLPKAGYSLVDYPDMGYEHADFEEVLTARIKKLTEANKKVTICGVSYGAGELINYLIAHPEMQEYIDGILIAGGIYAPDGEPEEEESDASPDEPKNKDKKSFLARLKQLLISHKDNHWLKLVAGAFGNDTLYVSRDVDGGESEKDKAELKKEFDRGIGGFKERMGMFVHRSHEGLLKSKGEIKVPTKIMWWKQDLNLISKAQKEAVEVVFETCKVDIGSLWGKHSTVATNANIIALQLRQMMHSKN